MTLSTALPPPDLPFPDEYNFRLASLRLFLRFYQRLRPEIVRELRSRVGPPYYRLLSMGSQASEGEKEAFHTALWGWVRDFRLPETPEMIGEATLILSVSIDRPVFWLDAFREFLIAMSKDGAEPPEVVALKSHAFEFQGRGWTPAQETIEGAESRLRAEFESVLRQHVEAWSDLESAQGNLRTMLRRDRKHVRNILWLAIKQACPHVSLAKMRERYKDRYSIDTIRRGLRSAADCLELRLDQIREASPGKKPGQGSK